MSSCQTDDGQASLGEEINEDFGNSMTDIEAQSQKRQAKGVRN
jgi:hypothetical protein